MWIVFTDLDGTLLDFDSYDYRPALDAIEWLKKKKIPIIIVTSKTYEEVKKIRKDLRIEDPFVVENGAAVFVPFNYRGFRLNWPERDGFNFKLLGESIDRLQEAKNLIKKKFKVVFLRDMELGEIERLTGLSREDAEKAKMREFSEPFILLNRDDGEKIEAYARSLNLKIIKGRRFYHLVGDTDKGKAVSLLKELYRKFEGEEIRSIGLGDSFNDIPIFENVEYPILLGKKESKLENIDLPGLINIEIPGPEGWKFGIFKILKFQNFKN